MLTETRLFQTTGIALNTKKKKSGVALNFPVNIGRLGLSLVSIIATSLTVKDDQSSK